MSISSMLVPVGPDLRDEKVLRYVCGLDAQSVRKVLIVTAVDTSGVEAPVAAAEVDRAGIVGQIAAALALAYLLDHEERAANRGDRARTREREGSRGALRAAGLRHAVGVPVRALCPRRSS